VKKALLAGVLLFTFSLVQFVAAAGEQTLYGYISCSKCGAKGTTESHRDCMDKCLAKNAGVVLVADDDHHLVGIENPDAVRGNHAHHVALDGYMKGDVFHVLRVRII